MIQELTPTFSTDWSDSITHWPELFLELGLIGKPDLRFLEVGCFEGRTTLWLLEHVLTHPSSSIFVIDPFTAGDEQRQRFDGNIASHIIRVGVQRGPSEEVLRRMDFPALDFAYIDGSHAARDVLADAVHVWPILKPGAAVVFDDYYWPEMDKLDAPGIAVDAFVSCYEREIERAERCGRDQYLIIKASS